MIYRYIYRVINLIDGKSYIGQHTTKKIYDNYYGSGSKLRKEIKILGLNNFIKGIIEFCKDSQELNEKEKFWIKHFDTINKGYNICEGGGDYPILYGEDNPFYGKKHSEETRKTLSNLHIGKEPWNKGKKGLQKASEKQKLIASQRHSGEGNWNYQRKGELSPSFNLKRSKETIQKLSDRKKGINNPNVGLFQITTPDNRQFKIDSGIPEFLKNHPEYDVNKWILYHAKRLGEYRGWKIVSIK